MIKYFRTNIEGRIQTFYLIDKTGRIVNTTKGIAEHSPEFAIIFKNGEKLIEVGGDDYDHAIQRFLKAQV